MIHDPNALVSVIIPVYMAEDYLPACLDSVLTQSYGNLEAILIDDGSTDSSPAICDGYAARDPRVRVVHQSNGGIARAQNTGLDLARGDYIAFVDNDDILDRRNLELLLHALRSADADMSKARWQQFGPSRMDHIRKSAQVGAPDPQSVTVFRDPLAAYQNVFCKSLRILGDLAGRHAEARYLNEANWCRLYRAQVWEGIRFPEGRYAQDTAVAGQLYNRMGRVADIDVTLYNWLQRPDSVTHREHSAGFYSDHVQAALENMAICRKAGVTPARSYYTLMGNLRYEQGATAGSGDPVAAERLNQDRERTAEALKGLNPIQRLRCQLLRGIRTVEKTVYDRRIKNMA